MTKRQPKDQEIVSYLGTVIKVTEDELGMLENYHHNHENELEPVIHYDNKSGQWRYEGVRKDEIEAILRKYRKTAKAKR